MSNSRREARLELTQRALSDLRAIQKFSIKEWGRRTSIAYLDDIEAALDRLRENPELLRLEPNFAMGLHFYRVRKHFLVCDYQDDLVIVLTVIHTSMDLPTRLSELEPRLATESQLLRSRLRGTTSGE